ncbi:hypothetical protein UA01_01357 [Streptococcus parasanguinis]|uniref:hypothetical protein n=1 Tax=Streptococcus parasanguinis TaxID=1318 RepID=UPI0005F32885|nr:hypothetical protein [Streptococcus parasanguinis]KJU98597.1 hypothetical protein UA01_01357 [Streptococcus parasanguinis]
MLLFIYMIYVISSISKMKREGQRVSLFTKIVVYGLLVLSLVKMYYGLLVLSLVKMYYGLLAFLFSPLPLIGSLVSFAIGGMMLSLKIVIALALLLLSLSLFLDSKKSDPDTPLVDHWLRLGVHILLIII